ncbi:aspartate aminotransferase family protein [Caenispirillum salinarum]|uniref:aspartate aminotransferase family protein n=1 Tax=Caenispirillum salinarum TaxID=859058 RepID=UPI0038501725
MTHVFHRQIHADYPTAVAGDGCYIVDADGKRYLDASGGAAVSCLGHSDRHVIDAVVAQLQTLPFAHTGFFTNRPLERLADMLTTAAPGPLDHVYFVSGGSEAIEAALKMARQYFLEIGQPARSRLIARRQSYHGNTLGALAAGGNQWRRAQFEPMLVDVSHIAPCYPYRDRAEGESLEAYGRRVADELEAEVLRLGPETVAAFVAEPVVGATAGALAPVPGYFKRIREICDRYGVLLILDEVMCGMGRTGSLFAYEQEGIVPDLVTVAKGLGAGYQPIGATLVHDRLYDAFRDGTGFFQHGHTYMGHPAACAAAVAVQERLTESGMMRGVNLRSDQLFAALRDRFGEHPHVGDIRGRGLFIGLEFVADRATKAPFDPARGVGAKLKKAAMAQGLMVYPMGGTIDGRRGDHCLIAPPFIISEAQVAELVDKLAAALDAVLPEAKAA